VETRGDRLARRLSRRTTSGRYIAEIDGLRFVAIAMVVLFHAQLRLNEAFGAQVGPPPAPHNLGDVAIAQGRFGVHLFFVISGFILGCRSPRNVSPARGRCASRPSISGG
jgi:peptidoglycan/LPS O-acetylase OafA/YrhL